MLVGFVLRGIYKGVLPSLAFDRGNLSDPPPAGFLIPYDLYSRPRNNDQAKEINFYLYSNLAI